MAKEGGVTRGPFFRCNTLLQKLVRSYKQFIFKIKSIEAVVIPLKVISIFLIEIQFAFFNFVFFFHEIILISVCAIPSVF